MDKVVDSYVQHQTKDDQEQVLEEHGYNQTRDLKGNQKLLKEQRDKQT